MSNPSLKNLPASPPRPVAARTPALDTAGHLRAGARPGSRPQSVERAALNINADRTDVGAVPAIVSRRALHATENAVGDRLAFVAELNDEELGVLRSVIDGLSPRAD
jgi:hypothetical protein